jgi:hypothetical protein
MNNREKIIKILLNMRKDIDLVDTKYTYEELLPIFEDFLHFSQISHIKFTEWLNKK